MPKLCKEVGGECSREEANKGGRELQEEEEEAIQYSGLSVKLPEYLESMLGKMAKKMPGLAIKEDAEVGYSCVYLCLMIGFIFTD